MFSKFFPVVHFRNYIYILFKVHFYIIYLLKVYCSTIFFKCVQSINVKIGKSMMVVYFLYIHR